MFLAICTASFKATEQHSINSYQFFSLIQVCLKRQTNWTSFSISTWLQFSSVQFCCSVMSNSLWLYGLQHTRSPCPSPTLQACSILCPSSWWGHPTISSSSVPFSSCFQSFPASGSFPMSQLSHKVAKILEFQFQHQSFQWTLRTDLP